MKDDKAQLRLRWLTIFILVAIILSGCATTPKMDTEKYVDGTGKSRRQLINEFRMEFEGKCIDTDTESCDYRVFKVTEEVFKLQYRSPEKYQLITWRFDDPPEISFLALAGCGESYFVKTKYDPKISDWARMICFNGKYSDRAALFYGYLKGIQQAEK